MTKPFVEITKIEGLAELRHALLQLPKELHKKALRGAVSGAALVVRNQARANVPLLRKPTPNRKSGTLRRAIRAGRSKQDSSAVQEQFNVFVRELSRGQIGKFKRATGKHSRTNPDDPFYWKVWEFGNGINRSHAFLRPAFDNRRGDALRVLKERLAKGIKAAAFKLNRGPKR